MKLTSLLYESVTDYPFQYMSPESDAYVRYIADAIKDELLDGIDGVQIYAPQKKVANPVQRWVLYELPSGTPTPRRLPRQLAIRYSGNGVFGDMPIDVEFTVKKQLYDQTGQLQRETGSNEGVAIYFKLQGIIEIAHSIQKIAAPGAPMYFRYETPIDDIIAAFRLKVIPVLMRRKAYAERELTDLATQRQRKSDSPMTEQVDSKSYGYTDKRSDEYVRYVAGVLRDELQSGLDGLKFTKVKTSERANSFVGLGDDAIARDLTVSSHGTGEFHGVTGNMSVLVHKHQDAKYDTDNWDAEQDDDGPALLSSFDGIRVFIMFRSRELNSKLSFRFEYETPVEEIVETLRTQFVPLLNQNLEEYIKGPDGDY